MCRWIIFFVLLLLGMRPVAHAATVGMVTRLTGKAEVAPAQGGEWKPLRLMRRLEQGERVRCGADSEVIITLFASAEQCVVAAGTTLTLDAKGIKAAPKGTGLRGAGIQIARAMGGDRPGGFEARPAQAHQRLQAGYPGWLLEGTRVLTWAPIPRAAAYSFTLFDKNDNIVWSQRVTEPRAVYAAELPFFVLRRPYVWRLCAFGESGKPLPESRWGILTFLAEREAQQLTQEAQALEEQAKAEPKDTTALFLLAELYRSYGVLEKALETLERPELEAQEGIKEAQEELYQEISRYASVLRTPR